MERKIPCRHCGQETVEHGHGMCPECYLAWYCGLDKSSNCACCGFGDRRMLVKRRLDGVSWTTLCGNCALLLGKRMIPLEALREELFPSGGRRISSRRTAGERRRRERRNPEEMRAVDRDTPDRRQRDRRAG